MDNIVILGTASAFPTKERNHPSIYINLGGTKILLDCGEGTQRQIRIAGLSPSVEYIFITHWHGDHSLGVGGIIQSINMARKEGELTIFGPAGTTQSVNHLLKAYKFHRNIGVKTQVADPKKEKMLVGIGEYQVYGINVKHNVSCLAYKVKENDHINIREDILKKRGIKSGPFLKGLKKGRDVVYNGKKLRAKEFTYLKKGRSLVYITDTKYDKRLSTFAKGADVLIAESTFSAALKQKAGEFYHMTVEDAVKIATDAGVKKLFLIHTSQQYEGTGTIQKEAEELKKKYKGSFEVSVPADLTGVSI